MAKRDIDDIRLELTELKPSVNNIEKLTDLVRDCMDSIEPFLINQTVLETLKTEQLKTVKGLNKSYSEEAFESVRLYILNRLLEIKVA